MAGRHGHGHGSRTHEDNETARPLLSSMGGVTQEWINDLIEEKRGLLMRLRAMLALVSLIDTATSIALYIAHQDKSDDNNNNNDGYTIERSVVDVIVVVSLKGVLCLVLSLISPMMRIDYINWIYWVVAVSLLLLVTKAIAFDWSDDDEILTPMMIISLAMSAIELGLIDRILDHDVLARDAASAKVANDSASSSESQVLSPRLLKAIRKRQMRGEGSTNRNVSDAAASGIVTLIDSTGKQQNKEANQISKWAMAKILKPYFWPVSIWGKIRCGLTWVFLGISKATNLFSPIYIGRAVQKLTDKDADLDAIYEDILWYSLLSLASKIFRELQSVVYLRVKQHAYAEIAEHTFIHLHSLSLEWHVKKKMGNVLRSMDRGVSAADTVVSYLFLYLVPSVVECVIIFVIFYTHYDIPALSATAFLCFALYCLATVKITLWRSKFRDQTNKHDNDYHDKATDSLVNFETVKYFTAERFETQRFTSAIVKFQKYTVNTQLSLSFLNSTQSTIIQVCSGVCLCIAAHYVMNADHSLTVGDFVSVNVFIMNMFAPLSFLGTIYNAVIQAFSDMTNLSELLAEEPDVKDAPDAQPLALNKSVAPTIEFRNIYFHYPTQTSNSGLQGVHFKIEPGTETAVVGQTGSGKTTLSRLLFRFYDPLSGQVLINNQDISRVTQESLRKSIGVVPQDTVMFNDTIKYNIQYGRQDATMAEIENACRSAQILDFILSLPKGFDTPVGERGLKLSGGEKQRVAIARCLLKNPPIVILDEATSALDSKTEQSVQAALNDLANSRTTLIIAHRLSTIRNAHQIIVLDHGKVVEKGNHNDLVSNVGGPYHSLWTAQLRTEDGGDGLSTSSVASTDSPAPKKE